MALNYGGMTLPTPLVESASVYKLTRTAFAQTDTELLATITSPNDGDLAIIDSIVDDTTYGKVSYQYSGEWIALVGNVDADKVIIRGDITMAGNYTQVGNLTKTQTGTAKFATDGKSVADALTEIFSKRLQPTITANPSLGNISISQTGAVECGTSIASVRVNAATFNAGSYTYGPSTGVAVNTWTTTRVTNNGNTNITNVTAGGACTDTGPFVMGDQSGDFTTISYRVTAAYGDGVQANDNLGSPSNPAVKISAGSTNKTSGAITTFRKFFYGAKTASPATVDGAYIRSLTNSTNAASNGRTFSITIPEGATIVTIAYPATLRNLTSVKDTGAFGTDIVGSFQLETVQVAGANGYAPINYKVYTYRPATALGSNTYDVTI